MYSIQSKDASIDFQSIFCARIWTSIITKTWNVNIQQHVMHALQRGLRKICSRWNLIMNMHLLNLFNVAVIDEDDKDEDE